MLLNLQTAEGSLLQIVLCGQPEFEETLKRPELRQLRQRIALRCRTAPLTLEETGITLMRVCASPVVRVPRSSIRKRWRRCCFTRADSRACSMRSASNP